ncbi:MAG: class I SAM-dependent methyltransferase [Promethearchaeota archaeon]|nr:MAG: class I SAM-dependent methyltransferase [Candidatus Lokiarchaeota archaeon]
MSHQKRNEFKKTLSKKRFGKFSRAYVTSKHHGKSLDLEKLLQLCSPQKTWNVLDIATGGGHTALKFAPYVSQVIATDITTKMLQSAQEFIEKKGINNIKFEEADAEALPFEDNQFDLVTCRIAAHHFPNIGKFVRESYRVLKKKGYLLLEDQVASENKATAEYINNFEKLRDPSHVKTLSKKEWFQELKAVRFKILEHQYFQKEIKLEWWTRVQNCNSKTIQTLRDLLKNASVDIKARMEPKNILKSNCTFKINFILIKAQK